MDDLARTEAEISRLRERLDADVTVPAGMISRLEAGVTRAARGDTPVGWEPRVVVACVMFAIMEVGIPGAGTIPLFVIACIYPWIASWSSSYKPSGDTVTSP
jgi:hypothetical protein